MQRKAAILILTILFGINQTFATVAVNCEIPVRVIEVKDLGLSEADETKSVIEVRWEVNPAIHSNYSGFNVTLEITYADGAILIFDEKAESSARFIRIEIPSLHIFRGKKPATVKEIKAFVTKESK